MTQRSQRTRRAKKKPVRAIRRQHATQRKLRPRQAIVKARAPITVSEAVEKCLIVGDLSPLTVDQRLEYYRALCKSLGLNPLTRPFEYIVFTNRDDEDIPEFQNQQQPQGKMVLYARADCCAQLRKIHKVGIRPRARRYRDGDFYNVEVDLFTLDGRTDTAIGIVPLRKWKRLSNQRTLVELTGRELANAMMKAETKAKRRGTLSICGLHMLEESELDGLLGYGTVTPGGRRMINVTPGAVDTLEDGADLYERAVDLARLDKDSQLPFKQLIAFYEKKLRAEALLPVRERNDRLGQEEQARLQRTASPPAEPARAPSPAPARPPAPRPAPPPAYERAMTWFWNETDQAALIEGNDGIKSELKQLLGKYVRPPKFQIVVNGDELEALKYEMKERGVEFKRRYPKV